MPECTGNGQIHTLSHPCLMSRSKTTLKYTKRQVKSRSINIVFFFSVRIGNYFWISDWTSQRVVKEISFLVFQSCSRGTNFLESFQLNDHRPSIWSYIWTSPQDIISPIETPLFMVKFLKYGVFNGDQAWTWTSMVRRIMKNHWTQVWNRKKIASFLSVDTFVCILGARFGPGTLELRTLEHVNRYNRWGLFNVSEWTLSERCVRWVTP